MKLSNIESLYSDRVRVIGERTAAELLGISAATLRRMASRNGSPQRIRISERRVGYRLDDIQKWLVERSHVGVRNPSNVGGTR